MVEAGTLQQVTRGLYAPADFEPTEHHGLATAAALVPNGVVCLLSALQFHEIGTQSPFEVWLAIDRKARKSLPSPFVSIDSKVGSWSAIAARGNTTPHTPATPSASPANLFRLNDLIRPHPSGSYKVGPRARHASSSVGDLPLGGRLRDPAPISRGLRPCRARRISDCDLRHSRLTHLGQVVDNLSGVM